jgi:hypothetical protein
VLVSKTIGAVALAKRMHRTYMWREIRIRRKFAEMADDEERVKWNENQSWAVV